MMQSIRALIQSGESYLVERGVPNARRNVEWILSHALGCRNTELYMNGADVPEVAQVERFNAMLARRGRREPLQYVLETTEFMSLPFESRPGVFIPRPDTEILVETTETLLAGRDNARVCDLCCGSGAISIALARRAKARVVAVDMSPDAVSLTRRNADLNRVKDRVRIIKMDAVRFTDLYANVTEGERETSEFAPFDVIVSNPPYVPSDDLDRLPPEIRDHEPPLSLDGGRDGLDFYRAVIPRFGACLKAGGVVVLEIGDGQGADVSGLLRQAGYSRIAVHDDYTGCARVVSAVLA